MYTNAAVAAEASAKPSVLRYWHVARDNCALH